MRAVVLKSMLAFALVTLGYAFSHTASAADVQSYKISRGRDYQQRPERVPTNVAVNAFAFEASVVMSEPGSVSSATVKPPGRPVRTLGPVGDRELRFVNRASRKSVIDDRFPTNGNYTFSIGTRNDGDRSLRLPIKGAYPSAPFVHSLVELQAVNPNGRLVVSWQRFANGTAADFIRLRIEDTAGNLAWESRGPGERGALDGTATLAIIGRGELRPATSYNATLFFEKFVTRDTNSYPGALGLVSYYARTRFTITTTSDGPADVDRYELSKGRRFEQDDASSTPDPKREDLIFLAQVRARQPGLVVAASLTTTLESVVPLVPDALRQNFEFSRTASSNEAIAALFPPGNYVFDLETATQGDRRVGLWFDADDFPSRPRFIGPAQEVSRDAPVTVSWHPWDDGTRDDFIHLRIEDEDGETVFETPDFDDRDALDGHATSVTIPAGILRQAEEYKAFLTFRSFDRLNWFDYPGALGISSIFATTEFDIQTIRPDLEEYSIARGQGFKQEEDNQPTPDPNDEFIFDAQVEGSADNAISSATLTTPRGATIRMVANPPDEFEFSDTAPTLAEFNQIYPVGNYRFNIQGRQGALSVILNVPASPYPPRPHAHLVALGRPEPDVPVTISWDPWDGGTTNDFIQVRIQDEDGETVFETPDRGDPGALNGLATSVIIPPGPDIFQLGELYEGRIRFERFVVDGEETLPGAEGTVSYFSRTDFNIHAFGPDVEDYRIERGQRFEQTTTDPPERDLDREFQFTAEVQGSAPDLISSVSLMTPLGGLPIVLDPNNAFDEFDFSETVATQAELDAAYPPGLYTFTVRSDNGTPNLSLDVPVSEFPQVPHLQFDPRVSVPGDQPLVLSWHQWVDGTEADFIRLRIEDASNDPVFETPTLNSPGALHGLSNSVTIPAGTLKAGQIYEGQLTFARIVVRDETTLPGAEGRVTYFSRTDFDIRITAVDVEDYRIERGHRFEQTTAGQPVPDPGGEFEFNAEVQGTAPGVVFSVSLTTPPAAVVFLAPNNARDEFEFSDQVSTQAEFETLYPAGTYNFNVLSSNQLSQTIPLEVPASAFPPPPHVQFNPGTMVRADQQLVLNWDAWAGGTTNDFIHLRVEDTEGDVVFETPDRGDSGALNGLTNSVTILADDLLPGEMYEARLVFERVVFTTNDTTGAEGRVTYFARTDFNIETVPGDLEDYRIERGQRFEQITADLLIPDLNDEFEFNAEVQGSAPNRISSATLKTPRGTNIVLEPNNDFDEFEFSDHASTQLEFDSLYPPGPYEFSVQRVNQGLKTITVIVPTNDFPPAPHVVFDPRAEVPPDQPLTISWERWGDGVPDDFIRFRLLDADNNVVFETGDRGAADALNGESVSVTIPEERLAPVQTYEARLIFERILLIDQATVRGAEGRVIYFSRTDFDIETSGGDIEDYRIERGRRYEQTTGGMPVPDPNDEFEFNAEVQGSGPNLITSVTLTTYLGGPPIVLDPNNARDEFEFSDQVSTQAEFDSLYPPGTNTFIVQSVNQGPQRIDLEVPASEFPPAPHVVFDPRTERVAANSDFIFFWDPWVGGTNDDFIQLRILDADNDVVFETLDRGDTNALNGLSTTAVIPAGTLVPGRVYEGRLVFERIVLEDETSVPGADGRVIYFARTDFDIETLPPDVQEYDVFKEHVYVQTSNGPPAATEFVFRASVEAESNGSILGAVIETPFGQTVPLTRGSGGDFQLQDSRASQDALDTDYPDGNYRLIIDTQNDGPRTIPVMITGAMYPSEPQLSNYDAAQVINAAADFVLTWNPFLDGTAQDHIDVQIEDSLNAEVFDTPGHGNAGALDGLATSVTVPAFTLAPAETYEARILFQKILRADDAGYPGVVGRVGYSARTFAGIATLPAANPPPLIQNYQLLGDGSLQFNISTLNGGTYQIQGSPNMIDWTPIGTISARSGLSTFTVPPPSGGSYFYRAVLVR